MRCTRRLLGCIAAKSAYGVANAPPRKTVDSPLQRQRPRLMRAAENPTPVPDPGLKAVARKPVGHSRRQPKRRNERAKAAVALKIMARRLRVATAYTKGAAMHEIAEQEGLSTPVIFRDLEWVKKIWLERAISERQQQIAYEL